MNSTKKGNYSPKFLDIFDEIFLHLIFRFLDIKTLINVSISCKHLNRLFEYLFEQVFFLNPLKLNDLNNKIDLILTNNVKIYEMHQPHINNCLIYNLKEFIFKSSTFYSYSYTYNMICISRGNWTIHEDWKADEFMVFQDDKKDWYFYHARHGGDGSVYYGEFYGGRKISITKFKTLKDLVLNFGLEFQNMMISYSEGSSNCIYITDNSW